MVIITDMTTGQVEYTSPSRAPETPEPREPRAPELQLRLALVGEETYGEPHRRR